MPAWTTSGDYLNLTDKETVISDIEDVCAGCLSDASCLALKRLKLEELRILRTDIVAATGKLYNDGKAEAEKKLDEKPKKKKS